MADDDISDHMSFEYDAEAGREAVQSLGRLGAMANWFRDAASSYGVSRPATGPSAGCLGGCATAILGVVALGTMFAVGGIVGFGPFGGDDSGGAGDAPSGIDSSAGANSSDSTTDDVSPPPAGSFADSFDVSGNIVPIPGEWLLFDEQGSAECAFNLPLEEGFGRGDVRVDDGGESIRVKPTDSDTWVTLDRIEASPEQAVYYADLSDETGLEDFELTIIFDSSSTSGGAIDGCGRRAGAGWLLEPLGDDEPPEPPEPTTDAPTPSSEGGTIDSPTPEGTGSLPGDAIRIGEAVWMRDTTSGQCFVQEQGADLTASVWGTLDDGSSFSVDVNQDGSLEMELFGADAWWVAGTRNGTELSIDLDAGAQTVVGTGLFSDFRSDAWARGSFTFACDG